MMTRPFSRWRWLFPLVLLGWSLPSFSTSLPTAGRTRDPQDSTQKKAQRMAQNILRLLNQDRLQKGLTPLTSNPLEAAVAAQHSADMASGKTPFGHQGAPSRMDAIQKQLGPLQGFAENVAFGQSSAQEVVDEWLHSKIHKQNIEGDFTLTGIGMAQDANGRLYFTEVFTR